MHSLGGTTCCATAVSEDDNRRSALHRYVTHLRGTGEYDFARLQIAAVAYLKNLDKLHDDRAARAAADVIVEFTKRRADTLVK